MMNPLAWNVILVAAKWVLIGLIYSVLFIFLIAVRREMGQRIADRQPQAPAANGRLRVVSPGDDRKLRPGTFINLRSDTSLGAEADNDIALSDPYISGHHARLCWDGDTWWVEDLGSRNGTLVGGQPCPRHSPQRLPAGTRLQIGGVTFELVEAG